jgi:predicted nucleic acid-binding protein
MTFLPPTAAEAGRDMWEGKPQSSKPVLFLFRRPAHSGPGEKTFDRSFMAGSLTGAKAPPVWKSHKMKCPLSLGRRSHLGRHVPSLSLPGNPDSILFMPGSLAENRPSHMYVIHKMKGFPSVLCPINGKPDANRRWSGIFPKPVDFPSFTAAAWQVFMGGLFQLWTGWISNRVQRTIDTIDGSASNARWWPEIVFIITGTLPETSGRKLQPWQDRSGRPGEQFEIAAITVAEPWHGVERATGAYKTRRQQYLQTLLNSLPIIPDTEQTAYEHARLWAELESAGRMIGFYDVIGAATALERGSQVATFNRKHFLQIKGLTVIEPS